MARMKFLCDAERCIECNSCVTACKQEHDIPWGVNRRRVVTLNDGVPGERSISVACMHCSDAPCMAVCPVDCFYKTEEGVVLHDKDCASAAATASTPVRSARRSFRRRGRSACAARWTNARSAPGAPRRTIRRPSSRSTAAIVWPRESCRSCAEMCSTKALLGRRRRGDRRTSIATASRIAARVPKCGAGPPRTGCRNRRAAGGARLRPRGPPPLPPLEGPNHDRGFDRPRWPLRGRCDARAGCGERPQVINYKQGKYQGKPDTPAFNNPPFNGNKRQWENEINTRTQAQNEYVRLRD